MNAFKSLCFVLILTSVASHFPALAQTRVPTRKEDSFSVKGIITRADSTTKTIRVKNEGGLELTYHLDDPARIRAVSGARETSGKELPFSELRAGDSVEIEYRYNENYEKIALSVRKLEPPPTPASLGVPALDSSKS